MIRSLSRHSARTVRMKRSAVAFAFGARTGGFDDPDAFAGEDGVEVAGELAVAVADQEAKRARSLVERPGELARLLGDPWSGRVGGAAGEVDVPATQLDEEEHVQPLQRDRLDGEEVDCERALRLCPWEGAPGESASRAGRAEPGLTEDLLHGGGRDCDAEAVQLADDPLAAPARIFVREAKHQLADLAGSQQPGKHDRSSSAADDLPADEVPPADAVARRSPAP